MSSSQKYYAQGFTKGHSCLSISVSLDTANWLVILPCSYSIYYLVCHPPSFSSLLLFLLLSQCWGFLSFFRLIYPSVLEVKRKWYIARVTKKRCLQQQANTDKRVHTEYLTIEVIQISWDNMTNFTNSDQANLFLYKHPEQLFYFVQPHLIGISKSIIDQLLTICSS